MDIFYSKPHIIPHHRLRYRISVVHVRAKDRLFMLTLDPAAVMHGQVWRLFTWIITPPVFGVDIFTIIMLIFFTTVWDLCWQRTIETFLYNLYMFSSMLFTMIGIMLAHSILYLYHKVLLRQLDWLFRICIDILDIDVHIACHSGMLS